MGIMPYSGFSVCSILHRHLIFSAPWQLLETGVKQSVLSADKNLRSRFLEFDQDHSQKPKPIVWRQLSISAICPNAKALRNRMITPN
jgi:hypothetical protein